MDPEKTERLISAVYDAAVDNNLWPDALVMLADLTHCARAELEIHDRERDSARSGLAAYFRCLSPLCPPEALEAYVDYWHTHFCWWGKTDHIPVGKVFASSDVVDVTAMRRSDFYNEWLVRLAGGGGEGRCVNLIADCRATVMLGAYRSKERMSFERDDQRAFDLMVPHFMRAVGIQRRLRLAEAQRTALDAGSAPAGFVIVDRHGRVLSAHEPTLRRLRAAELLAPFGNAGRLDLPNPAIERLIRGAASRGASAGPGAGHVDHRVEDGALLRIAVIPLSQSDPAGADDRWRAVDRPAALLHVTAPEEVSRASACRLAELHGLTAAEAAVAVEIARGDGRAAVAARLGIRESTVRSHLSAIFEKLGIHRQAELTRIVTGG